MQRDQFIQQHKIFDKFHRPTVVNAQCIIGNEKSPDAVINWNMLLTNIQQHMEKLFHVLDM